MLANQFVTGGIEQPVFFDVATDIFTEKFFTDKLRKVDLFFEVSNTINRGYTLI
jgi:hypothetical protein